MIDPDDNAEYIRGLASHLAESASDGRRRLLEEHSASYRWLMASLLALNAGGLLFLKDAKLHQPDALIVGAVAFYLGIVFALAIAKLGQKAARAAIEPLSKLSTFWVAVAQSGEADQTELEKLNAEINATTSKAKLAPLAGWLSFLAFSVGVGAMVVSWRADQERPTSSTNTASGATSAMPDETSQIGNAN